MLENRNSTTKREWMVALAVALAALALTSIPYVLGYAFARPGFFYTGIVMNPEDSQSYFAKMLQGYDGYWLYTIPFTSEDHNPEFVGGFYIGLGHLARATGLSLEAMWHLARLVTSLLMYLMTFRFIGEFLQESRARWTAFMLALFGSGLGWLLFLLNQPYWLDAFPVDFKMPEAHLLFAAMTFPHVAAGTSLVLASLWLVKKMVDPRCTWRFAVAAGLVNLAVGITYPFLIYLVVLTSFLYWSYGCLRARHMIWRSAFLLSIAFLIPAPLFLRYAYALATNPVFRAWDAQAITLSPPFPHYLFAYGIMLLFGALFIISKPQHEWGLLWAWIAAVALLVYAPVNPQRRFVEGVQVPLAILTAAGLSDVALPWAERTRIFQWFAARPGYSVKSLSRFLIAVFLVFMGLSNIYILASSSITAALQQPYPLFRPQGELDGVEWLRSNTPRAEVVLGAYESGNYVAAHAGNRVVLGHWAETVDWQKKYDQVDEFSRATTDDETRHALLVRYHVTYVWWGARERELGNFNPGLATYLQAVYSNPDVTIYRVRP